MLELAASGVTVYPALLVGIGFLVGLFGGLLGLGGGWLIVPSLSVMGMRAVFAVGTSLAAMTVSSAVGVSRHASKKRVLWPLGLKLGLFSVIGVEIGKRIVVLLNEAGIAETALRVVYLGLLAFLGTSMARGGKTREPLPDEPPPVARPQRWHHAAGIGLASGTMAGILGIGGGIVIVPLLTWLYAMPVATSVATGLVSVLCASVYGMIAYAGQDAVDFVAAAFIAVGGVAGSLLGAHLAHRAREHELRRLFALQAGATGLAVAALLAGRPAASRVLLFGGAGILGAWTIVSLLRAKEDSATARR